VAARSTDCELRAEPHTDNSEIAYRRDGGKGEIVRGMGARYLALAQAKPGGPSDERRAEGGSFHGSPPPVIPCGFGLWREHGRMDWDLGGMGKEEGGFIHRSAITRKYLKYESFTCMPLKSCLRPVCHRKVRLHPCATDSNFCNPHAIPSSFASNGVN
jgi:hypothetical protein